MLFFLVEKEGTILKGWTSGTNKLKDSSAGLLLPLQRSSSSVAQVFRNPLPTYLTADQASDNPADRQLLALFATSSVLLLPIRAHERTLGVVVLGMPEQQPRLPGEDLHLLNIIARQEYQGVGTTEAEALQDCLSKVQNASLEDLFPRQANPADK